MKVRLTVPIASCRAIAGAALAGARGRRLLRRRIALLDGAVRLHPDSGGHHQHRLGRGVADALAVVRQHRPDLGDRQADRNRQGVVHRQGHGDRQGTATARATPTAKGDADRPGNRDSTPTRRPSATPSATAKPTPRATRHASTAPTHYYPVGAPQTGGGGTAGLQDVTLFGFGGAAILAGLASLAYRRRLARKRRAEASARAATPSRTGVR